MFLDDAIDLGNEIGKRIIKGYQETLTANKKIATRKTYNGFTFDVSITGNQLKIVITAHEGLFHIEAGKRANTKLPVKREGGRFVLVDELEEWKRAVAFGGSDFLLARAIARKKRVGIPITEIMWMKVERDIRDLVIRYFSQEVSLFMRNRLREIYSNI